VAALVGSLSDTHLLVRVAAARAIGKLGTKAKAVVPQIKRLEQDPFEEARQAACIAVQKISF
jgi:HEAT repeat protein